MHAVYGNFPYVLGFVVLLTFILLARAFRSLVLPLKAAILNLVSLGAAFGIIVFIFQQGHGSEAIWSVPATQSIIPWIPLMIFAFLFGLSMDYEVFMLSRMREAYDETGDTPAAVALGLARTGKLVTSAAAILMFAFFVLSSSPGTDIKQFGIGLAAGIIFDATVIRALLVPALMRILGEWNWWLPGWAAKALFVPARAGCGRRAGARGVLSASQRGGSRCSRRTASRPRAPRGAAVLFCSGTASGAGGCLEAGRLTAPAQVGRGEDGRYASRASSKGKVESSSIPSSVTRTCCSSFTPSRPPSSPM